MLRMKDLAARLGLSQTTVSHVLSGRAQEFRISAQTVARVQEMAEKLGYRSNALARALRDQRSYSVGLVVEDLTNPFWTGIAIGAESEAEQSGYILVVSNTSFDLERERRALGLLREGRVDGLLLPPFAHSGRDLEELHREGLPFVQIDRALPKVKVPCVRTDHEAGSRLAVDHLARRGHRKIAFVVGPSEIQPYHHRTEGFRAAIAQHGIQGVTVAVDSTTPEAAQAAVAAYLRQGQPAPALYAASIWLAVGALRAVREARLEVPRDLEIVGFDDITMADLLRYPITTVVQDVQAIGREAFKLLMALRAGDETPGEVLIPPTLNVR